MQLVSGPIKDTRVSLLSNRFRQNVIDKGGIDLLVRLCEFPSPATRTNALWALRNMLYKNDLSMKTRVMEALTWPTLQR
jgi:hypothetical protein